MNPFLRWLALAVESAAFGPRYGRIKDSLRSAVPLDPEETWDRFAGPSGPLLTWLSRNHPPGFVRRAYVGALLGLDHRVAVTTHYDASNAFYELVLDRKYMFYSCADHVHGTETLEEAQENKASDVVRMLAPRAGERTLDLGCGWGGMLRRVVEETGDRESLVGYTLSQEQVAYNGQHGQFDVRLTNFVTADYASESFDKMYSIGAWEHVRPREVPVLLRKLHLALRPGGRFVLHFICMPTDTWPATAIAAQIFFPGAMLWSYKEQLRACEAAGFRVNEQSLHDYRRTLRAWFDNLVAHREEAIGLVGVRRYNEFLVFFPTAWRFHDDLEGMVLRLGLEKPAGG
jgi:cyclopropane-fatty-acyl-phospholipid synthase